jgi:hypothetical protein
MVRDPDRFFGTGIFPPEMVTVAPADAPVVPDVTGEDAKTAEQDIADAGFKFSVIRTGAVDSGTVIKQSPVGGTIARAQISGNDCALWVKCQGWP